MHDPEPEMSARKLTPTDHLVSNLDSALRTLFGQPKITERPNPARGMDEADMDEATRRHTARLMRINHTGEVCAQGLYQGQALTARRQDVRDAMERSAAEENDHLDWCEQRLQELDDRTSLLNPAFYLGSLAIGATAGLIGDKWSLGFVGETERQVEGHLESHLAQVPEEDMRTRAILKQMKADEIEHGEKAMAHGGAELPEPVKKLMGLTSKLMTKSVYRI
jgi:ubiquinone biosynthesis monooxygenase Coq7